MGAGADEIVLTGIGLVSPVGFTAAQSCAAIRAGITRITEYPEYVCLTDDSASPQGQEPPEEGEVLRAGVVPGLPSDMRGPQRMWRLALLAFQRLFSESRLERNCLARTALLVALPLPDTAVAPWALRQVFVKELCHRANLGGWAEVALSDTGPVGVFQQIQAAADRLRARHVDFAVVLAVDSFLDVERLSLLDDSWRLQSSRSMDGFIPGEAATALLLEVRRSAERRGAPVLARLGLTAFGTEPSPIGSEQWSTGVGLCDVLRSLASTAPGHEVGGWMLCDLNGESYRANEWGLARTRLAGTLPALLKLSHPAGRIGDAGTALAGILIACATQAFLRGYAPAPAALVWTASDDGQRAGLVLRSVRA